MHNDYKNKTKFITYIHTHIPLSMDDVGVANSTIPVDTLQKQYNNAQNNLWWI